MKMVAQKFHVCIRNNLGATLKLFLPELLDQEEILISKRSSNSLAIRELDIHQESSNFHQGCFSSFP